MSLAQQQLSSDYEKLKQEEAEKSTKLQDLMYVSNPLRYRSDFKLNFIDVVIFPF